MNTRSFAQSISKFQSSAGFQPNIHIVKLACGPVIALQTWWQAEAARRRQLEFAEELHTMTVHARRDIGIRSAGTDWIARHDA